MKTKTTASAAVLLLLAASGICLGVRHFVDARHARSGPGHPVGSTGDTVDRRAAAAVEGRGEGTSAGSRADELSRRFQAIFSIVDATARTRALLEFSSHFQPEDWKLALKTFDHLDLSHDLPEFGILLSGWTEKAPLPAMEWALAHHDRTDPEGVVVQTWLAVDRDAALAWLLEPGRIEATRTLGTSAASALFHDREAFVRFLEALPEGLEIDILVHSNLSQDRIPYERIRSWFGTLSAKYRQRLLTTFLYRLQDPQQQIAMLHDFGDDGSSGDYTNVFIEWAKTDRAAAFAALDSLDLGKALTAAWQGILSQMVSHGDIPAAVDEMYVHPEHLDDSFLQVAAFNSAPLDPVKSLEINSMVQKPELREFFYRFAVPQWRVPPDGPAREALENWVATHDEPESVMKLLEKK